MHNRLLDTVFGRILEVIVNRISTKSRILITFSVSFERVKSVDIEGAEAVEGEKKEMIGQWEMAVTSTK